MGRATAEEKVIRHREAFRLLANGYSYSSAVSHLCATYGVSRPTARRIAKAALAEFVEDFSDWDRKELVAQGLHRLQEIARKAEDSTQYGAAIGAWRTINDIALLTPRG